MNAAPPFDLATELIELAARARARAEEDPFGNPVLAVALAIQRRIDEGDLSEPEIAALIRAFRDRAFAARSARLGDYVGLGSESTDFSALAARLVRPDPGGSPVEFAAFRAAVERTRFAAVFTAHPTFAHPPEVYFALAAAASGQPSLTCFVSHRPERPTLAQEFAQALSAIHYGRDAIDALSRALLNAAREAWPNKWSELQPRPVSLASWVGYDTDGRTDIAWWDSLRFRLISKERQLARLRAQVENVASAAALIARLKQAEREVAAQIAACPTQAAAEGVAAFAASLIGGRELAIADPQLLQPLFATAMQAADEDGRMTLAIARAGLAAHGLSLAHTHVRLNASQVHNAVRLRLGLQDPPADLARRRTLLASLNAALDRIASVPVDFGAVLAEQASAARLMMIVAQIVKHIDTATPVRFLIAETESGATLLATLWLARLFGIADRIEISPLFETESALTHGARLLEEALRSPHWRDYLCHTGRMALQFGYSDSGRYIGQLAASYQIERLRLKVADLMVKHGLADVELVLFDTHGESIGRGAHPGSLLDRLRYLSPSAARQAFARARITVREESAFQGGDGYLLFGTPDLAKATIGAIAKHAFASVPARTDPIYAEPDFAADFFVSAAAAMRGLVEEAGYAALLGAFGPALLDASGSRPPARQSDAGGSAAIHHPRELRAIPNNAILQQLGWCANTLQGIGDAAARMPEPFAEMRETSPRFRRALDFAHHALQHSDIDVLRAVISLLDPGSWLDRAAHTKRPGRARALVEIAGALEQLDLWAEGQATFRRIQADHARLREAWPSAPRMSNEEMLLHALRIALIGQIWLLAVAIPEFSPRHGITREALVRRLLRLDVPGALAVLAEVFPAAPDPAAGLDYAEPAGPRGVTSYRREHDRIFAPIARHFALVREIGTAITHHVGAFG